MLLSFKRIVSVFLARNKEFYRDSSALGWSLFFPIIIILGFAYTFQNENQTLFKVALLGKGLQTTQQEFLKTHYVQFIQETDVDQTLAKLKRHQIDMVLDSEHPRYWINSSSPKGYLLEKLLSGSSQPSQFEKMTVSGMEIRYVDWLISGLLSMNMMFSALYGVGYHLVRYRKTGVLKRLSGTPLTSFEFLIAQTSSRLLILGIVNFIVYFGSYSLVHFQMLGSYADLLLVFFLGSTCLISLGLLVASRTASEEFANGLLNFVAMPMIFFAEVWFSLEGAHPFLKNLSQIFPLTHVIHAARAVMTEGATLAQISTDLVVLAAMTVVFLSAGALSFKWK